MEKANDHSAGSMSIVSFHLRVVPAAFSIRFNGSPETLVLKLYLVISWNLM